MKKKPEAKPQEDRESLLRGNMMNSASLLGQCLERLEVLHELRQSFVPTTLGGADAYCDAIQAICDPLKEIAGEALLAIRKAFPDEEALSWIDQKTFKEA